MELGQARMGTPAVLGTLVRLGMLLRRASERRSNRGGHVITLVKKRYYIII